MSRSPLSFITENPTANAQRRQDQHYRAEDQARRQQQTFDMQRGVDDALREGYGERDYVRDDPVASRLAETPGGGSALAEMGQERERTRDDWRRSAVTALGQGDLLTYQFAAQRGDLQLPDDLVNNATRRARFAEAALTAEQLYGDDHPDQAGSFIQTYLANNGDPVGAFEAAGAPYGRPGITAGIAANIAENSRFLIDDGRPVTSGMDPGYAWGRRDDGSFGAVRIPGVEAGGEGISRSEAIEMAAELSPYGASPEEIRQRADEIYAYANQGQTGGGPSSPAPSAGGGEFDAYDSAWQQMFGGLGNSGQGGDQPLDFNTSNPAGGNPGGERAQILEDARDALRRGADPRAVAERLRQWGINPESLR